MSGGEGRKKLTLLDATLMVMGGIIGVGIFFNPRRIAEHVPEPWLFLGLWVFGGVVAIAAAFTFAELGASFPHAGGWFVYLRAAFGPFPAFLFAWVVLFVISTGALASIAKFCASRLHLLFPAAVGPPESRSEQLVATGLIVVVTAVAMTGVKRAALLQNVCMITKLLVIAALIVGGLLTLGAGREAVPAAASASAAAPSGLGLVAALLPLFYTFGGWQLVGYIAPEVRDPERTLPRAILLGVAGVVLVYLAVNGAYVAVLGIDDLASDPGFANTLAQRAFGERGGLVLAAGMAISAFGICAVNVIASPWLYVAMAREGLFFQTVGKVSPRTGVPERALLLQAAITFVYLFGSLDFLVDAVVFVEWMFHFLAALALLVLRARARELPRPFTSPFYPLAPALYLATAVLIVGGTLAQAEPRLKYTGLTIMALGALVYRPWRTLVARAS